MIEIYMTKKQEFLDKVEAGILCGKDLFLILEIIKEFSESNEDIMELLEDLKEDKENIVLNFIVQERKAYLSILDGVMETKRDELAEHPTLTISMAEETALMILKGKIPIFQAYKDEKIGIEGPLVKLTSLSLMLDVIGNEIGVL